MLLSCNVSLSCSVFVFFFTVFVLLFFCLFCFVLFACLFVFFSSITLHEHTIIAKCNVETYSVGLHRATVPFGLVTWEATRNTMKCPVADRLKRSIPFLFNSLPAYLLYASFMPLFLPVEDGESWHSMCRVFGKFVNSRILRLVGISSRLSRDQFKGLSCLVKTNWVLCCNNSKF